MHQILFLLTAPHPHGMGLGANGVAPEARLKELFLKGVDRKEADYEPAMQKLIEQGWVKRVSDRVQLTEEGYQICK
jgi:coproporphyrinogen III oxidase-like Fe-S oxidoreductase